MKHPPHRRIVAAGAVALAAVACMVRAAPAVARAPDGSVSIIVPFSPGGNADTMCRLLAENLAREWGQPVIVENIPGAGTMVGTQRVARAPGDGRTLGYATTALTINPGLNKTMPYDTARDLTGVIQLTTQPLAIVAPKDAPYRSMAELIDYAKAHPRALSFGSPGIGTGMHLAGELLNQQAGIDLLHVPYKGSGPAQIDLIGKRLNLMIDTLSFQLPAIKAGEVKLLAITTLTRHEHFPDFPTVSETIPGFAVTSNAGFIVSSRTPKERVEALNASIRKILKDPKIAKAIAEMGLDISASSSADYNASIRREMATWAGVIATAGLAK